MPEVSIIIVNWNGKEDTCECIKSIYKSHFKDTNFEIVLVDNNSSDGSVEFIRQKFPRVKIVKNNKNVGPVGGFNIGLRNSSGRLICILGNDTVVDRHWLSELVSSAKGHGIAIAGSRIRNLIGYGSQETCGETINVFFQVVELQKKSSKWTSFAPGCSMIFKRELFDNQPFISEYFGNCEDIYISVLARLKSYEVVMNPDSFLIHKGGASVRKVPTIMDFHMEKNTLLNFFILYQRSTIVKLFLPFILLQIFNLLLAVPRAKAFVNKLKSYLWVIRNYKLIFWYRKIVAKQRIKSDKELIRECISYKLALNGKLGDFLSRALRAYLRIVGIRTMDM